MWCDPTSPIGALALCVAGSLFPIGVATPVDHAFPVNGPTDYVQGHHDYPAVDIFGDCGARVRAPVDGTVLEVSSTDDWDPATDLGAERGGLSFAVRGDDGVRYYGSHLDSLADRVRPGATVVAGEVVGRLGRTGSARGTPCHLHFGVSPPCRGTGQWWVRRGVVDPYPFLRSWERGGNRTPDRHVDRWKRSHDCRDRP